MSETSGDFDPLVLRAMARWPDVPAVYGWLRLDRRGHWLLVDRGQAGFDEARHGAGSPITSPPILEFIGRNYACDARGCWFWQNGPQRVFVTLESAPWVLRVLGSGEQARLITHTGILFGDLLGAAQGPEGEILLQSALGCGLVHDLDASALALDDTADDQPPTLLIDGRRWVLAACTDPAGRFGFVRTPSA